MTICVGTAGVVMVILVWLSVLRTVFIPRETSSRSARRVARGISRITSAVARQMPRRAAGRVLDFCAPVSLFALVSFWLLGIAFGYLLIGTALGIRPFTDPIVPDTRGGAGLLLAAGASAVLILAAFVVHLHGFVEAYHRRELLIARLSLAGTSPARADSVLTSCLRAASPEQLDRVFGEWADWLVDIHTTHLDCPALLYSRPAGRMSWPTAAVIMMDAAALVEVLAPSRDTRETRRLLTSGAICVRRLADRIGVEQPVAIVSLQGREEAGFDDTVRAAIDAGITPEGNPRQMWTAFQLERSRYAALAAALTHRLLYDIDAPVRPSR